MSETNFASLNPALLARKGGAKPAMRPQHGLVPATTRLNDELEDLGWNDMGSQDKDGGDDNVVQLPGQDNAVHRQQRELADKFEAEPQAPKSRKRRSALARGKRAAFTLRLDAERHLKLRLASTVQNRSAQQLLTEALDAMLDAMPDIDTLAAQVKRKT